MGAVEPDVQMPGEVHQPGLRGLLLATETGSTKVERSGADLIGTLAVDRIEDVLLLFRCTENPPENANLPPAALGVSALAFSYTENSSFPYTPNVVALTPAALLLLIAGIRKRVPFRTVAGRTPNRQ